MIQIAILAAIAFASTNIDDALVLLAFFANPSVKGRDVVVGQYVGTSVIVLAALVSSTISAALPDHRAGWLGLLPILVGLRYLRSMPSQSANARDDPKQRNVAPTTVLSVALVIVANGVDDIATYIPLFARQATGGMILVCFVILIMVTVWCLVGLWLVEHPALGAPIRRWGRVITPLVLISLGLFILASRATF